MKNLDGKKLSRVSNSDHKQNHSYLGVGAEGIGELHASASLGLHFKLHQSKVVTLRTKYFYQHKVVTLRTINAKVVTSRTKCIQQSKLKVVTLTTIYIYKCKVVTLRTI